MHDTDMQQKTIPLRYIVNLPVVLRTETEALGAISQYHRRGT